MTSHDVVDYVRKLSGHRRVGHAGTLDPGAAGVLVLGLGAGTRLTEYVMDLPKTYRAEVTFGVETDTGDAQGAAVLRASAEDLTAQRCKEAIGAFAGTSHQRVHPVSAVRHEGKHLYELTRAGHSVPALEREVHIFDLRVLRFLPGDPPRMALDVHCSKGTYIRTLAHDLGRELGCGAHLSFLLRAAVGPFRLCEALTLEELKSHAEEGGFRRCLRPLTDAVSHLQHGLVKASAAVSLRQGRPVPVAEVEGVKETEGDATTCLTTENGALVALASRVERDGVAVLCPTKVFPDDEEEAAG